MAHQPSIKCFKTLFFAKLSLPFCLNCMFDIVIGMLMINNAFAYWKKLELCKSMEECFATKFLREQAKLQVVE